MFVQQQWMVMDQLVLNQTKQAKLMYYLQDAYDQKITQGLEIERSCNVLLARGDGDVNNGKNPRVEQKVVLIVFMLERDGAEYFVSDTL